MHRLVVNSGMDRNSTATPIVVLEELGLSATEAAVAQARDLLLEYGRFVVAQPGAARFCFGSLEK